MKLFSYMERLHIGYHVLLHQFITSIQFKMCLLLPIQITKKATEKLRQKFLGEKLQK